MRIALSLALVAVLAAACSKKEEAAKAPEAAAPAAPAAPALAAADLEGPKPGKWKMTTNLSAAPKPVTVETCVAQTSFKDMDAAKQQAGVTCSEQSYRREGADIVGHSVCTIQGGMKVITDSRISGDFTSRYTIDAKTVMDPAPTPAMKETTMKVTAERIGDC
ncbi:ABC-type amino acid transport substrate-binding protein [Phenylobacterium haematophilum]|jgi:ABC-type amino acid transport substrate-binding protein|uniref:ABC-type amino acid transport substrate-binding protein n=1 Tax=Phenylobacterium haematophilum TaxID=98513 RepID=A0A840A3A4_9CAUL|nr:DUF3617 family protein [Phenylobacterium haematophilum]MBB3893455.1 ABC-type amino acid transport substrate-binding protein [Phenylobacterium haematophilum]